MADESPFWQLMDDWFAARMRLAVPEIIAQVLSLLPLPLTQSAAQADVVTASPLTVRIDGPGDQDVVDATNISGITLTAGNRVWVQFLDGTALVYGKNP